MVFIPKWSRYNNAKPSGKSSVNWNNPLAEGLVDALIAVDNPSCVQGVTPLVVGYQGDGDNYSLSSSSDKTARIDYGNLSQYRITGALTIVDIFSLASNSLITNRGLTAKWLGAGNQRSYSTFINYQTGAKPRIGMEISSDGAGTRNSIIGATVLDINKKYISTAVYRPSASLTVYLDGKQDGALSSGVLTGIYNSTASLWRGNLFSLTDASAYTLFGKIYDSYIYNRALSADEVQAISEAPYQILKPHVTYFDFGGGSADELVVSEILNHTNALGTIALTQANVLSINGIGNSQSLGTIELLLSGTLDLQSLNHTNALGTIALTQANVLSINGIGNSQSLGTIALTQSFLLSLNALNQAQTIDGITLSLQDFLSLQNLSHSSTLSNISLVQANVLSTNSLDHTNILGAIALLQYNVLSINGIGNSHSLGTVSLLESFLLSVGSLSQSSALSSPILSSIGTIDLNNVNNTSILDNIILLQSNILSTNNLESTNRLSILSLIEGTILLEVSGRLVLFKDPRNSIFSKDNKTSIFVRNRV